MEGRVKLTDVADVLHEMKEKGIIGDYAVGGASAVAFYTEPISTKDLDIFFLFDPPQTGLILSLEPIYTYCREKGFPYNDEFISIGGWLVQFVESGHVPLWKDALANSVRFSFDGVDLNVLPPEHLAAMWATVARPKDILKIQHFVADEVLQTDKLKDLLTRFDLVETWRRIQGGLPNEFRF